MKGGLAKFLECGASNPKVMVLIPVWAILFRVGLNDPCGSIPSKNIL